MCQLTHTQYPPPKNTQTKTAIRLAEATLLPWLQGSNKNPLLYDTTWGGLVIQNGLSNPYVNFGNTYYNDHHFQYGYFAYAAAVIAKFDPGMWVCGLDGVCGWVGSRRRM